ncbi:MAG: hypothetical protein JSS44_04760 [Proteobacteria bacterium]|nr:hypothetical protein [Pseudomonadota bacterium]MBS0465158.1 hypothetical protein [Pseudomonadota bacterium]
MNSLASTLPIGRSLAVFVLAALCALPASAQRRHPPVVDGGARQAYYPGAVRPGPHPKGIDVPECRFAGAQNRVDLGTRNGSWSVTGPAQIGLGGPTSVTASAWSANANDWIQPFSSTSVNGTAATGTYTYTLVFNLPCAPSSYQTLSLVGSIAADNTFTADLNGQPIASCSNPSTCVSTATAVTTQPGWFRQGQNVLTVAVKNWPTSADPKNGGSTGLAGSLYLRVQCGKMCCKDLPSRGDYPTN